MSAALGLRMLSHRTAEHVGDRPSWDYLFAAAAVGIHALVTWRTDHGSLLAIVPLDRRQEVYAAGATVTSILFGFSTAAITFYLSAQTDRMSLEAYS